MVFGIEVWVCVSDLLLEFGMMEQRKEKGADWPAFIDDGRSATSSTPRT